MSDNVSIEPEKPVEQENPAAPASPEAQPNTVQEPSRSVVKRSQRGVISLICGIASIILALLTLLPGSIAWVGYLGLVATLIALLAARGVLRKHGEADRRERKLAQAGVATGLLSFVVFVALFVVRANQAAIQGAQEAAAILTAVKAPPKTFESADFTLSYPGGWTAADTTQKAECKDLTAECLIWLDAPLGDGRFVLFRYPDPGAETADEFDRMFWTEAESSGVELVSRQDIQVDQRLAIQRIIRMPAPDNPNRRICMLVITTANNDVVYQFMGAAGDSAACDGHRATFDSIIRSFDFKVPLAAQATWTATVTLPRPTPKPTGTPGSTPKNTPVASTRQTFKGDGFTVTYPKGWVPVDVEQSPICQGVKPPAKCALVISTADDESLLVVQHAEVPNNMTAEQIDTMLWTMMEGNDPSLKLESREEIEIDGLPAIKRVASMDDSSSPTGKASMLLVAMATDNVFYQIMGMSTSAETFEKSLSDMESVLDSWRFVP